MFWYHTQALPHVKFKYLKNQHGTYRSLERRILGLKFNTVKEVYLDKALHNLKRSAIYAAFARLDKRIFSGLRRCTYPIRLKHHYECTSWVAQLFKEGDASDSEQVWQIWNTFERQTKERYWPHLLIYLLEKHPHRALSFIHAVTYQPCVKTLDIKIITDSFEHLSHLYCNEASWMPAHETDLRRNKPNFIPTLYHFLHGHLQPFSHMCTQELLYKLVTFVSVEDLKRIYDLLQHFNAHMGYDTLLHYASAFARAGDFRTALDCLRASVEVAIGKKKFVDEDRFNWTCALIIRKSMLKKENYHQTTEIVAAMLELGLKLDIRLYNCIISNAMDAGDYSTSFKVYNTLSENGLTPDKYTLSSLLNGCTKADDPAKFKDFAEFCAESAKEINDPWLAADFIYFQFMLHKREFKDPAKLLYRSNQMIQTYLNFFSPRPLEPFWSADFTHPEPSPLRLRDGTIHESVMEPPPIALYIMLQLEILKARSISSSRVSVLYERFASLIHQRYDPNLCKLARTSNIWNAFLHVFCRKGHFEYASDMLYDMPRYGVQPDITSWNMFMHGFFRFKQVEAAERVFDIMRAKGIDPDQFTYELQLEYFARFQQVNKIGGILEHLDDKRQDSPELMQKLAKIHDQERAQFELEKARVNKERRRLHHETLKAEQEKALWAPRKFEPLLKPKDEPVEHKESLPSMGRGSPAAMQFKPLLENLERRSF